MKYAIAISLFCASGYGFGKPPASAIEACMKVETVPNEAVYTEWTPITFGELPNPPRHRKEVLRHKDLELVGLWRNTKTKTWGLSYNGYDIPHKSVVRLDRKQAPYEFEPYKADWGEVVVGKRRYICISFNFDGIGRSGSYQNVRGIYLIEPKERGRAYYTAGNIANFTK